MNSYNKLCFLRLKKSIIVLLLRRTILSLLKFEGGTSVQDLSLYYAPKFLTRVVNWFHISSAKQWASIETMQFLNTFLD